MFLIFKLELKIICFQVSSSNDFKIQNGKVLLQKKRGKENLKSEETFFVIVINEKGRNETGKKSTC